MSSTLEKSINSRVTGRFFDFALFRMCRILKISAEVDFVEKESILFPLNVESVSGLNLFKRIKLFIFAAIEVKLIPQ